MLSSGLRKVMKALLILLVVAWITTDATATQLLRSRLLASIRNALSSGSESAIGRTVSAYRLKKLRCGDRRGEDPAAWKGYPGLVHGRGEDRPEGAQWPPLVAQGRACAGASPTSDSFPAGWHREKALAVPVGGAIHSTKSGRFLFLVRLL